MKRTMLYFGSFNPIHKGHVAVAEYVVRKGLSDETVLMVSPQSPYKEASDLAPELDRFEMAEIACASSPLAHCIKPSVVEFMLPKPSYTIDTLRYLEEQFGSERRFSLLMGADQIEALDGWKEYERILEYPVYVYPRRGERVARFRDRITILEDAPMQDVCSTLVRERLLNSEDVSDVLDQGVIRFIRNKGLWSPESRIEQLTQRLLDAPDDVGLLLERGRLLYRLNRWGPAINDFNAILALEPTHAEALEMVRIVRDILEYRYKDIYNP